FDLEIVSYFATQAASLVHAVNLGRLTSSNRENLNILALIGNRINSDLSLPEIGRLVLENVIRVLNAYSGTIWMLEEEPLEFHRLVTVNMLSPQTFRPLYFNSQLMQTVE